MLSHEPFYWLCTYPYACCVYAFVWRLCVFVLVHVQTCRECKLMSGALFYCVPFYYYYYLKYTLSLNLLFTDCLDWLASDRPLSSLLQPERRLPGLYFACILRIRTWILCLHCRYFTNWANSHRSINPLFRINRKH